MRIALVANPTSERGRHGGATRAAVTTLVTAGHDVVVVHGSSYDESRQNATALLEHDGNLDALVVVGGDGTFLRAARYVLDAGTLLYDINLGHLGFLSSGKPDSAEEDLENILNDPPLKNFIVF